MSKSIEICEATKKIIYPSHNAARAANVRVQQRAGGNVDRHSYFCKLCGGYHFGRQLLARAKMRQSETARARRQELRDRDLLEEMP